MPGHKVRFFPSPAALRRWFDAHHATAPELWVGFYRTASRRPSVTWPESVDEALRVGWIDGIRKRVDDVSYVIRFTPRRPRSIWSAVNIRRAEALIQVGQMRPAGLAAFQARRENRSGKYSYEQRRDRFDEPYQGMLRQDEAAWAFFQAQPASYRKTAVWYVVSAKKEETRLKRLKSLIHECKNGRRII
jgi:uncharacterized protein YdeI (YjbR/CyaY-like superfamily)